MLEELCRADMWNECQRIVEEAPLVRLKATLLREVKKVNEFDAFFGLNCFRHNWTILPLQSFSRKRKEHHAYKCWHYFVENGKEIINVFIEQKYGKTECAMRQTKTFDALFDEFLNWFEERRNGFMDKVAAQLNEKKAELSKIGKLPQSHGGVANLLKVLTKTMYARGTSIHTVAKVQYAVCLQAGIYIPDEFLTDVLVAADILDGGAE